MDDEFDILEDIKREMERDIREGIQDDDDDDDIQIIEQEEEEEDLDVIPLRLRTPSPFQEYMGEFSNSPSPDPNEAGPSNLTTFRLNYAPSPDPEDQEELEKEGDHEQPSNLTTFRHNYAPSPDPEETEEPEKEEDPVEPTSDSESTDDSNDDPLSNPHLDTDPKVSELLTRYFASSGIPLSAVQDPSFIELIQHLNPEITLPKENVMSRGLEKHCRHPKPVVNYQKSLAPLSATLDIIGDLDDKYLVYSIHYFEDLYERKNVVYMRKMLLSTIDLESIFIPMRRAVNAYSFSNVKFSNLVCPTQEIFNLVCSTEIVKRYYVCFSYYMTKFVTKLLNIEELSNGLEQLRNFIRLIRDDLKIYGQFRRLQLSKQADMNLPDLDDEEDWISTAAFLTNCLVLHDNFNEFSDCFGLTAPLTNDEFVHLLYFQRLFDECLRISENLSNTNNSISQVVPAMIVLRTYLTECAAEEEFPFQKLVRDAFNDAFQPVTRTSGAQNRYDLSTLMDPRYAYRVDIYATEKWRQMEQKACEEFVNLDQSLERCFYNDISIMDSNERQQVIANEFQTYRNLLMNERPDETAESPFMWWGRRQTDMEFLSVLSREYLASPATCIDAKVYFNKGSGKFDHIVMNSTKKVYEDILSVAGSYQKYRGKGYPEEKYRQDYDDIDQLEYTTDRITKDGIMYDEFGNEVQMEVDETGETKPVPIEQDVKREEVVEKKVEIQEPPPVKKKRRGILRR